MKKIAFMGFGITEVGVSPDPSRIQVITQMLVPTNKLAIQRFIGMVNYLNTFCPTLAETRQDQPLVWADIHESSFTKAKDLTTHFPCLAYFDVNKEVLQVDASDTLLGGSLLQPNGQAKLQPVAFRSCLMCPNQQRWAQIEK